MKELSSQQQDIENSFEKVLKSVYSTGKLDEKTKALISIGISVHEAQEIPIIYHVKQALKLGAKEDEIIEAALVAIVFGGFKSMGATVTIVNDTIQTFK